MVIIGSTAIRYYYSDFKREPKDLDIVCLKDEPIRLNQTYKKIERLENPILLELYKSQKLTYATPNDLATLKASHLCWNINWDKHMFDLQFLLSKGAIIDEKLFLELYQYWNDYHGKNKRSDLKMSKEDFFTNAINYNESEHDELHKILNPTPIYTLTLKDGKEVELEEEKFHALSHEQKLNFVREEVMVMAYERYRDLNYKIAYSKMLKKFIIKHAPLFSLIFIFQNFMEIRKPKINYLKIIQNGITRLN